jgi:uncharacterized protein involved in tellurium resistance
MSEIKDLIRHALDQDYNKANDTFGEIMSIKMTDLINQEEIKVANSIYNGVEDTDDEEEGIVIDDADLDDIEDIEDDEVEEDDDPISDDEDDDDDDEDEES